MAGGHLTSADITRKHWMPFEAVYQCVNPGCGAKFTAEPGSKYHCFSCGNVFCLSCASHVMPLDPGTAQFTVGGILARVCSLCLEQGKEAEAPGEALSGGEPVLDTQPKSLGGVRTVASSPWQLQARASGTIKSTPDSSATGTVAPEMGNGRQEALAVGASSEAEEQTEASAGNSPAASVAKAETIGSEEAGCGGSSREGGVGKVTLEGFSFKNGGPEDRPDSRRPSVVTDPGETTARTEGPLEKARPSPYPEPVRDTAGNVKKGAATSSRAVALDRMASKLGKKGKTRVVELYDNLLVGETRNKAGTGLEGEAGASESNSGAGAGTEKAAESDLPASRTASSKSDLVSEPKVVPPSSSHLPRSFTRSSGSGSWLWGGLLGKAPKVDLKALEEKLASMTLEIQGLRGEVTTAEEQAVTVQAALDHLDGLLRSAALAEYLVIRTCWQSDTSSGMPSDDGGFEGEWLQRFLVLEDDTLSYYFRATDPRPQGTIPLSQVVEAGPLTSGGPCGAEEAAVHGFYVATCHGLQLQCASANKFKVELWLTTISEVLCQVKPSDQ